MIHYICREAKQDTIAPFLYTAGAELQPHLRITTYEEIFAERSLDPGHLIFTDLDRLTVYELEAAQAIAQAMRAAVPEAKILNEPIEALQRYALLATLWREGLNPFRVARLDEGFPALKYPVFIRREDEAEGPETELLQSENEVRQAIGRLKGAGHPLKGRLAVEYCAEPDSQGCFRKYGTFRIGDRILPQHIQFSDQWMVKGKTRKVGVSESAEEIDYIRKNPHKAALKALFDRARIDCGRMDYSVVGGRLVVYEINTNPVFPRGDKQDLRQERRHLVRRRLIGAFKALDTPLQGSDRVKVAPPMPAIHALPLPRVPHGSAWRLLGRSRPVDWAISLYWKVIPKHLRQRLPEGLKMHIKDFLGRSLQRQYR